jgi:hypothetical protein
MCCGEKSQLCTEEAKKRSILNKLWDGEISKRFVLERFELFALAKIFWLVLKALWHRPYIILTRLFRAKKKKSKKMSTNTKGRTKRTGVPLLSFFIASLILALTV